MSELLLKAVLGRVEGSRSSSRLRNDEGLVPASLYGKGMEPISLAVDARELNALVGHRKVVGSIVEIDLGGETKSTLVKEIQRHPVRRNLLHIDFQLLSADQQVTVTVALVAGEGVNLNVGQVELSGSTSSIPVNIEITSDQLVDGQLVASSLKLPKGVKLASDPDAVVAVTSEVVASE